MKKFFNMIEVTLAIAVVGLGMAGIMSLFPVGFQASRDAIGDNYASNAAEQFMAFIARKCNDPTIIEVGPPSKDFWEKYIGWDHDTPTDFSDDLDIDGSFTTSPPTPISEESNCIMPVEGNIYRHTDLTKTQIYAIKVGSSTVTDFNATVRIWRSKLTGLWLFDQNADIPYSTATRLNVEISWPVEKPYAQREKRYYCVELFRQKQ